MQILTRLCEKIHVHFTKKLETSYQFYDKVLAFAVPPFLSGRDCTQPVLLLEVLN